MVRLNRREFIRTAAACGANALWGTRTPAASRHSLQERRELFPQGVASGDPDEHSVILWTRRPYVGRDRAALRAEVSLDPKFQMVIGSIRAPILLLSDWTCRVMVGNLKPATIYWYRFIDENGHSSRVGRTITAPEPGDLRTVRFAFVSCQSVNEGAQNAYRRMIWEDERAPIEQKLGFVLHLGDFIYEVVEYPDEVPRRYDRTVFDIGRIPDSRRVGTLHVPTTLDGYRMVYRAHIDDLDIQDARAYFPFICIGDNHEFSWQGWQSFIKYQGKTEPAQTLRVAANQAWWEYIPSRVRKVSGADLTQFAPPSVSDVDIVAFDGDGLAIEANNLAAIGSMTAYRSVTYGKHVELILTDFHSYTMEDPTTQNEAKQFDLPEFPYLFPQEALEILEAGRSYQHGNPPDAIVIGTHSIPNFRKDSPSFTVLGHSQKEWLKHRLTHSQATWKIWGATNGTLDMRTDPQNLPAGLNSEWPGAGFATFGGGDFSAALSERAEVYEAVRNAGVTGFVTVSGDRHSFWAGYASKALPPIGFEPVGITFITGSISAPGMVKALEHGLIGHPLRSLYIAERPDGPAATVNLAIKRGVRAALEYAQTGDIAKAHALTNPDVAPHLAFVDMGGHGYSVVTAGANSIDVQFVCIPRPLARAKSPNGGDVRYRVVHGAETWKRGEHPVLSQTIIEGDPVLSI